MKLKTLRLTQWINHYFHSWNFLSSIGSGITFLSFAIFSHRTSLPYLSAIPFPTSALLNSFLSDFYFLHLFTNNGQVWDFMTLESIIFCFFISLRSSENILFWNLQLFYWHFLEILWIFIFLVFYFFWYFPSVTLLVGDPGFWVFIKKTNLRFKILGPRL